MYLTFLVLDKICIKNLPSEASVVVQFPVCANSAILRYATAPVTPSNSIIFPKEVLVDRRCCVPSQPVPSLLTTWSGMRVDSLLICWFWSFLDPSSVPFPMPLDYQPWICEF